MGLEDHPGYLWSGFDRNRGTVLIHADWPAYPLAAGWRNALISLARFPMGTYFERVDDIDRCVLLVAQGYGPTAGPLDERRFHVALWHEDVTEAKRLGFVEGVEGLTAREFEARRRDEMRADIRREMTRKGYLVAEDADPLESLGATYEGKWIPYTLAPLEDYDDDDPDDFYTAPRDWLDFLPDNRMRLTEAGLHELEQLLLERPVDVPEFARSRLESILSHELYDSALRELGVMIETRMRAYTGSTDYGVKLVDQFIKLVIERGAWLQAHAKVLRTGLRTAFKFIRNEFAHNLVDLPKPRAILLVSLMSGLLEDVDATVNNQESR